jgi:hypothetical protein
MPKLTITVEVPEFEEIGAEELRDAVKSALVDRVLGSYMDDTPVLRAGCRGDDPDDFEPSSKPVDGTFISAMRREAQALLQERVKAVVEGRTATVVDEVLAGEFQPVNRFGDRAKPTTLRSMIGGYGMEYLTALVDSRGQPATGERNAQPRVQFLIRQITEDVYAKELKVEVDKAVAEFKKAMTGKVAGEITQTVQRLLGLPVQG